MNKKIDLVISFDDTGSMSSVRQIVRSKISDLMKGLFSSDIDLRIGLVIQNDYCDPIPLITKDFTNNLKELETFINQKSYCGGGDPDECYEKVLNDVLYFNWREDSIKFLILIGDCNPHEQGYKYDGYVVDYDWKTLLPKYVDRNIKIYGVQALGSRSSKKFYETISQKTNGIKVDLDQLADIQQFIMAIFHKENGSLENYENSENQFKTKITFRNLFNKLKGIEESVVEKSKVDGLASLSKYQIMPVDKTCTIKDFVESFGLSYQKGKGFYEWTMREVIQGKKQIIFQDRESGEVFEDSMWCREQLGLEFGVNKTMTPKSVPDIHRKYRIYIQSTSYTRTMDVGTTFLYEIDHK